MLYVKRQKKIGKLLIFTNSDSIFAIRFKEMRN